MCNMRLQKLLYYVQGWALARLDRPAFHDPIEAWAHGPVVPTIYRKLKHHGRGANARGKLDPADDLDPDLRTFVASVWEDYRSYSAIQLRTLTHGEDPWKNAWNKRTQPDRCDVAISEDDLRSYFARHAAEGVRRYKPRQPDEAWFDEPSPFPESA